MNIKNLLATFMTIVFAGSIAMAQNNPPRQPNQGPDGMKRGMGRDGGDRNRMRGDRMPGGRGMRGMDFNRLNLNDSQKQRIQTLMDNNRKSFEANKTQFEEMGNLMRLKREGLLTTEQGNRLTTLEAQMTANREKMRNDILAVLTPEQKTLYEQMGNQPRGDRGGMMRMRAPGGPGQGRPAPMSPNAPPPPNQPNN